ncbi:thiopeptide-type bacteriocin biosynthesis protein [Flavobacterium reichenbachii]|uniref:Thiopeptide-type bacteriocin biosynthesis domain-containing protein n=1 Tax=Flavobacterium reichenbachii TaxID=362418 RepID=A0A085ZPI5_9FLAO|nr:thiopeptide-type bacteriocin biosynthesis protein [Flavobacterium reichenbachii]KFF06349.1 hypothetical protein IW19_12845 [Flavobacterium reichenbachii]OXB17433.1 hypothetical protein B0A68_03820 [Flavobacterium reichenbachii]
MSKIKRNFIVGEEWLYYKIYCGNYTADKILINEVETIVNKLFKKKLIDQWFFIRYYDPDFHLRIRFHLINLSAITEVIEIITFHLSKLLKNDTIYDVILPTYKREIERYGENTILDSEKLFYYNSKKIVELISKTTPEFDEIARIFNSLYMIANLLEYFEIPTDVSKLFVTERHLHFKMEHDIKKEHVAEMGKLFSIYKQDFFLLLTEHRDPQYLEGLNTIVKFKLEEIKTIKKILNNVPNTNNNYILDLIASFIHMNINRTFRSKQREYELICYDFMSRYYKYIIYKK